MSLINNPVIVLYIGYLCGSGGRSLYDWLWKMVQDPDLIFDFKYLASMLIALICSIILSMVTFVNVQIPPGGMTFMFFYGAQQGWVLNDILNKPITYAINISRKLKEATELNRSK